MNLVINRLNPVGHSSPPSRRVLSGRTARINAAEAGRNTGGSNAANDKSMEWRADGTEASSELTAYCGVHAAFMKNSNVYRQNTRNATTDNCTHVRSIDGDIGCSTLVASSTCVVSPTTGVSDNGLTWQHFGYARHTPHQTNHVTGHLKTQMLNLFSRLEMRCFRLEMQFFWHRQTSACFASGFVRTVKLDAQFSSAFTMHAIM